MKLSRVFAGAAIAVAVGAYAMPAAAENLLTNGSFETGDFTAWIPGGNFEFTGVEGIGYDGFTPQDGNYFAALGPFGSDGTLSQTFSDVIGKTYALRYYLASDGYTPNDFSASIDSSTLSSLTDIPSHGFKLYYFTFVGSGSDTLTFNFRNDPAYLALDNISISAVPEPATWAFMLIGLGGLGAAMRSRRKLSGAAAAA